MKVWNNLGVLALAAYLTCCASPQMNSSPATGSTGHDSKKCNGPAGFEAGFNDGRSGRDPNTRFAYDCRHDLRDEVWAEYQKGFQDGQKIWLRGK